MAAEWGIWEALKWLGGKAGGAVLVAKIKEGLKKLSGADKETKDLKADAERLNREIGVSSAANQELLDELEFREAQLAHYVGRSRALEDFCQQNGLAVPPDLTLPPPKRPSVLQKAKNKKK